MLYFRRWKLWHPVLLVPVNFWVQNFNSVASHNILVFNIFLEQEIENRFLRINPYTCAENSETSCFRRAVLFTFIRNYCDSSHIFHLFLCCTTGEMCATVLTEDTVATPDLETNTCFIEKNLCVACGEFVCGRQLFCRRKVYFFNGFLQSGGCRYTILLHIIASRASWTSYCKHVPFF